MNLRRVLILLVIFSIILSPAATALAQTSGPYAIDRWTISGGGELGHNGRYTVRGTIGQPVMGIFQGGSYSITSGFWAGVGVIPEGSMNRIYLPTIMR